ncbi:hypothetical protein ATANTOWER_021864 [Ataeniobius toweri]|uniref:Uncharacterized protein n=1 Tax=Ataeniobius toweri TaxID=208326 RepID=A0ABU7A8D5_9TELE|nr:hypothetical protein [Ataeniobius toweri]
MTNQVTSWEEPEVHRALIRSSLRHLWCTAPPSHPGNSSPRSHASFLCSLKDTGVKPYNPKVVEGVHLETTFIPEVLLAFWKEKALFSRELYDQLCQENSLLTESQRSHILLPADNLRRLFKIAGVCTFSVQIGIKQLSQAFSIVLKDQRGIILA